MPVSENEETGARPIALHSSDYGAGVPIKKRRFPFIRPPSPPVEEPGSTTFQEEIKLHKKERLSTSQGSVISSDLASRELSGSMHSENEASIVTEQNGSRQMESHLKESEKDGNDSLTVGVQGSVEEKNIDAITEKTVFSDVKLEEAKLDVDMNMELHKNEKSVEHHGISRGSDLQLAESQGLKLVGGSETKDMQLGKSIDSGEKDRDSVQQKIEGDTDTEKVMEPFSLKLSLADEKCSFACASAVTQSEDDESHLSTNRSNWDLNTTMDAWEVSVSGTASVSGGSVYTETTMSTKYDLKPLQNPRPFIGDMSSAKQNLAKGEFRSTCDISAVPTVEKCGADYLNLDLGPPISQPQSRCQSQSSSNLETPSSSTDAKLVRTSMSAGNVNTVAPVTVKSEPVEEREGKSLDASPLSRRAIKHELVEPNNLETPQNSGFNTIGSIAIKNEPISEVTQELPEARGIASDGSDKIPSLNLNTESCTETTSNPITYPAGTLVCLPEMDAGGMRLKEDPPKESDPQKGSLQKPQMIGNSFSIASKSTPTSLDDDNEVKVSTAAELIAVAVDSNVGTSEQGRQKLSDEVPPRKEGNEDYGSDGEKLDISAGTIEEDNYGSEYESDGNHDSAVAANTVDFNREDNEYEDGEVREQFMLDASEGHEGAMLEEHVNIGETDQKRVDYAGDLNYQCSTSALVENNVTCLKVPQEPTRDCVDTSHDDVLCEKIQTTAAADSSLQEPLAVESVINTLETSRTVGLPSIHNSSNDEVMEPGQLVGTSEDLVSTVTRLNDNSIKLAATVDNDPELKDSLVPAKIEEPLNGEAVAQDGNPESNRRRIINLSRASNLSSPDKSRCFPDRSLPLPTGRKRLPDVALEGDKPHHRGRDDIRSDDFNRFSRDRNQDVFSRNSRSNFSRDRGRVASNVGDDWDAEAEFRSEMYNGRSEFRGRYKYPSQYRYNVTPEGAFVGSGRGGRKLVTDEMPNFRHLQRRRSPGGRDGPNSRGLGIVGGVPRSISPSSRCLDMDDSELVGLRHGGKFVRDFPDDTMEPMYSYEEADGFGRGDRNIGSFKSEVLRRIRSKSPVRLRNRSPTAWSSPRRRSPEAFGHPELTHRRSPGMYRRDRMRSPERTCFRGEMMIRKQNSPAYMTRPLDDMREMNSGRDHGFRRPIMSNRSPSGRLPIRNRGYDMLNSRDRTHGEYFRMPLRTGRFNELGEDGNTDERRRLGDKRGPVRRFRAPYAAEDEGFMFNGEDASRSYRLCNEDDPVFHEKGNSREGQLDGRGKNRQGDVHKTRRIEEQEGNYRHNGQCDEFEDGSRGKRKRF